MRYDDKHKERTRQKILEEAAAAIREHGPDQIGVSALMAKAGLTHGGFYAHFKSKDELVAEAIAQMFEQRHSLNQENLGGAPPARALKRFINGYLSARHRDAPETGCPLPALSGDLARMPAKARKRFAAGMDQIIALVGGLLAQLDKPEPQLLASSVVAELVGALALARAVSDPTQSDRILESSRTAIKSRLQLDQSAKDES